MLKEGMFIQERYEIVSKIGTGGMADVYKAKDHKLNRFVAVKVLKPEFREDKAFISKFRVEAQSAAGLAHPNIVNVYDAGDDNGVCFIVMELVEGITLKEYIEKKGRLAVREATSIAIQVSMGLEAAHHNNIVHRDVKPQNIIISTDGKVKVTDFGIARAASSNTISSNVMGSVHYSSPEQARGGYSDYKSDIYSLGITMYEMLTGHVPFDGDTTVAIAIKHLQEEMQSPRKYVPELPKSIVQIIYKCTQKSPDRRYGDMAELIRDLKESLVNPDGDFVQIAPLTNHAQTVVVSREELEQIKSGAAVKQDESEGNRNGYQEGGHTYYGQNPYNGHTGNDRYGNESYGNGRYSGYPQEREEEDSGVNKKLEKFMTVASIVIGILILAIFLTLVGSAAGFIDLGFLTGGKKNETETASEISSESGLVDVPDVKGKTREEALEELNARGLGLKFGGEKESSEEEGKIVEQDPEAGSSVRANTEVTVYTSKGSGTFALVDVTEKSLTDAQKELTDLGLLAETEYAYDNSVEDGKIVSTRPEAGASVRAGDTITVVISKGPQEEEGDEMVIVPSVLGETAESARSMLEELGLYVKIIESYSSEYPAGQIMKQSISENTEVNPGSTIELEVSIGDLEDHDSGSETAGDGEEYSCKMKLKLPPVGETGLPQEYNGEDVTITIEQDGEEEVIIDKEPVEFPYELEWSSASASDVDAFVYIHYDDELTVKVRYPGIKMH